jgi:hypothetical protein
MHGKRFLETSINNFNKADEIAQDPNSGGHRSPHSTSLSAIIATLVPTLISASFMIVLFLVFRRYYSNIYEPRTYIPSVPEK